MKSNQQLKQEARIKNDIETKSYRVVGGKIVEGKYFTFNQAHLVHKKQRNITTASIRLDNGRQKSLQLKSA